LIEVIRSSGEEMWRVDAYQIPYYSRVPFGTTQKRRSLRKGLENIKAHLKLSFVRDKYIPLKREYIKSLCLIEVIRSSGEEMWRVDAYQIPYYSRGIEGEKRTHPRFADCQITVRKSAPSTK
jgi:uncharacterized LabA/DUF88 family protein